MFYRWGFLSFYCKNKKQNPNPEGKIGFVVQERLFGLPWGSQRRAPWKYPQGILTKETLMRNLSLETLGRREAEAGRGRKR